MFPNIDTQSLFKLGFVFVTFSILGNERRRKRKALSKVLNLEQTYRVIHVQPFHYKFIVELGLHTYGGHDYIQHDFHKWFEIDGMIILGVEHIQENDLIALMIMRPNLKDHVGCLEALRVHPKHRGKGLGHFLTRSMIETIKERNQTNKFAPIKRLTYVVYDENVASIQIAIKSGFQIRYEFPYIMIAEESADPDSGDEVFLCRNGPGSFLKFYQDCKAARDFLLGKDLPVALSLVELKTPEIIFDRLNQLDVKLLYQDWKPYDLTVANVVEMTRKRQVAYELPGKENTGVSFGNIREDGTGKICVVAHYWKSNNLDNHVAAARDFLIHIVHWLEIAQKEPGATSMYCNYPKEAYEVLANLDIPKKKLSPQVESVMMLDLMK